MNRLIDRSTIMLRLDATTKKDVLLAMSEKMAEQTGMHGRVVYDAIVEREKLGSTGVGKGVAVPHARLPGLDRVYAVFAQMAAPVAFDAVDASPVDLIFMILSPHESGADHLEALGMVSKSLRNTALCDQLRTASNAEAVFQMLSQTQEAIAA